MVDGNTQIAQLVLSLVPCLLVWVTCHCQCEGCSGALCLATKPQCKDLHPALLQYKQHVHRVAEVVQCLMCTWCTGISAQLT
jgi:hypothetical protein